MENLLKQWENLYDVALEIKALEPWKKLWDNDIITVILKDSKEPLFFSILGRGAECFGICCYVGEEAFFSHFKLLDDEYDQSICEQDALVAYFGDRCEIDNNDYKIIKQLGYNFRGRNNWLYFKSFKPGFFPRMLNKNEIEVLTEGYKNLFMALRSLFEQNLKIDFENGEMLIRHYDKESNLWLNHAMPLIKPKAVYPSIRLRDELELARLKGCKRNNAEWELDTFYFPAPMKDKDVEGAFYPRAVLITDANVGVVISFDLISPNDNYYQSVLSSICELISKCGRPVSITVKKEDLKLVFLAFCKDISVKLKKAKSLQSIEDAKESIMEQFME